MLSTQVHPECPHIMANLNFPKRSKNPLIQHDDDMTHLLVGKLQLVKVHVHGQIVISHHIKDNRTWAVLVE